jgi:hypothetical protein
MGPGVSSGLKGKRGYQGVSSAQYASAASNFDFVFAPLPRLDLVAPCPLPRFELPRLLDEKDRVWPPPPLWEQSSKKFELWLFSSRYLFHTFAPMTGFATFETFARRRTATTTSRPTF